MSIAATVESTQTITDTQDGDIEVEDVGIDMRRGFFIDGEQAARQDRTRSTIFCVHDSISK